MKLIFCYILVTIYSVVSYSQTITSKNFTVNNGLPSNSIKCFFKDSRGFFWIGTDAGLCKYDGKNFITYDESKGLKFSQIWSITEDNNNNLWLSLYGHGFAKFDGKKFIYYSKKNGLVNDAIRKIYYSKKIKILVIATENGLSIFNGKEFKSFIKEKSSNGFQITGIDEYQGKIIITSSYHGVYELHINKQLCKSTLDSLFYTQINYSSFIKDNTYYSSGPDLKIVSRDFITKQVKKLPCPIAWNFSALKNTIYLPTWNVINPNGGLYSLSKNRVLNFGEKAGVSSTNLWTSYIDKTSKQLWVGSIDKGMYSIPLRKISQLYSSTYFKIKNLNLEEIFIDNQNKYWIGAKDNIILFRNNLPKQTLTREILLSKILNYIKIHYRDTIIENVISKQKIENGFSTFNIHQGKNNTVWVNTTWGILNFDSNFNLLNFFGSDGGHSILENNTLYYGNMYGGIFKFKNVSDLSNYDNLSLNSKNYPRDITKIIQTKNLTWFASSSSGLYLLQKGRFLSLLENHLFTEKSITDITTNSRNELIIGTNIGKVVIAKWNGKKLKIKQVLYPNQHIYGSTISFVEYANQHLFIGTNKGINVLCKNRFLKLVNQSEGLNDIQFKDAAIENGSILWITTVKGLMKVNLNLLIQKPTSNKFTIDITQLLINNKIDRSLFTNWGILKANSITLPHYKNQLEISFKTSNLFNPDKDVFKYKIEGLSKGWSEFNSENKIKLFGIPNGEYIVRIKGKNLGTGELFIPAKFTIIISPPFWKTWWFIIISILLTAFIIYIYFKYKIKGIKQREQEKSTLNNKLIETKLEALRAQMNPHFTFNAINSIQNFIIDNDTKNAMFYLGEFSKLIRKTLENASEKFMSLENEIDFLESYMNVQKMRFDKIQTSIKVDKEINTFSTQIPPLIVQPFIENVFEHAFDSTIVENQELNIRFYIKGELLICSITDNGIGITEGKTRTLHKSFGRKLTGERLDLLNREFKTTAFGFTIQNRNLIDNTLNGTEVLITFPLKLD